jgi:predicted dehydrogenase
MIGTGGMARHHLRTLVEIDGVDIVAHVSPTPGHAQAAAQSWGGRAYLNHEEMLQAASVDAVWIAVPPDQHGAVERSLIERRIPFLVEKPLAADLETAEAIAALLQQTELIAAAGYNWRARDTVPELRRVLAQRPPQTILAAWHDRTPPPRWWHRRERGGGQLLEQATHLIDLARYVAGEARIVAATGGHLPRPDYPDLNVDTTNTVLLQFESGASGVVTTTCLLETGVSEVYVKFVCEGLLITLERGTVTYEEGRERRVVREQSDSVLHENRAFVEAVRHNEPGRLYCTYQDALRSHRLCWEAQERAAGHG